jgi:uncharacterized protein (DUF58 family)
MVREFRESRDRHLIVLLDAWVPEHASQTERTRVEFAISLAATIALDQSRNGRGSDVYFAMGGTQFREWGGATDVREQDELLDMLAMLRPSSQTPLDRLLLSAHREQTPHSRTILVTPYAERANKVDWDVVASETSRLGPMWSEPPQTLVADPAEIGEIFTLESML